jgi:hypothetical protein
MTASRRAVLLGFSAAATLAVPTLASGPAAAAGKSVDAKKVFPYLDAYLKLPPAERSRFRLSYLFLRDGKPLAAPVWLVDGAARTPIPLRADGAAARLPTLAQLDGAKVEIDVEPGTKLGVHMVMEPAMAPAAEMDARDLAAAYAQCATGIKKSLGILAMAMPKLQGLLFVGVPSGEAELADGRRVPLPVVKGVVGFNPAAMPGAKTLRFPRAPGRVEIG